MKKKLIFSLLFQFLSVAMVYGNRKVVSLNDAWYFTKPNEATFSPENIPAGSWEKINIPHTFNAQDGYLKKDYFRGTCLYRKEFELSEADVDKSIYISFEGILSTAEVFVNDKYVGQHKGGYTGFGFNISQQVFFDKKNILTVKVNNKNMDIAPLHGDFTSWGGIYRDVKLIITNKIQFSAGKFGDKGVLIKTPQVSEKFGMVSISANISNKYSVNKKVLLQTIIRTKNAEIVATQMHKLELKTGETKNFVLDKLNVSNPELWSPETPNLYTAETIIKDEKTNQVIDILINNIGFRWYSFDGEKGFFLNGKHLKLIGVNRHQDFEGLGNALTDDFHRRDVKLMKEMGVNFLRIAHYPQDNALLNECDRLGILCWEEIPMVDYISFNNEFYSNCETNLNEMIAQHFNHPSIICWGFMNEIFLRLSMVANAEKIDEYHKRTQIYATKLDSVAHAVDKTRLTTIAFHIDDAYEKSGLTKITDLVGWNVYKGWYGDKFQDFCTFMDGQHAAFPQRPLIVSEYGAGSDRRLHTKNGQMFDFSMEYQQQFHEAYLPYILERDYIAGASMWNMNDFGSADRDESMPRINNKGLLFYDRTPKDVYFYYQAMLTRVPVMHIATRDWLLRTATSDNDTTNTSTHIVKVYSNLKQAELFVNGRSLGIKLMHNCNATWQVPFADGKSTLVAKATDKNVIVEDATAVEFNVLPANLQKPNAKSLEMAVNCGSNCDFTDDKSLMTWLTDKPYTKGSFGYIGGTIYKSKPWVIGFIDQIQGTRNGPMFQTIRLGATGYQFDVPNGEYEVELCFTEPKADIKNIIPAENVFDVIINAEVVLKNWNIAANGGRLFAITKKFTTQVSTNEITIELKSNKGTTLISGIKICRIN